eukprot:TRINITY_DN10270_c0_g1_i1.p1 TRINITY_DN10270_c0_g1~~TRINITY_DN10270_c0_g1_i1.p1  ORF type:complete len:260 (-),score=43.31 TRINITY_DN10270_c0_g1_i1:336-1004(-)
MSVFEETTNGGKSSKAHLRAKSEFSPVAEKVSNPYIMTKAETHIPAPKLPTPLPKGDTEIKRLEDLVKLEDPSDYFINLEKIGEGTFGLVFSGTDLRTLEKVAIKKMALNKENNEEDLISEIEMMTSLQHPNIVRYIEGYKQNDEIWVIMEFMGGGSLTEILEQFKYIQMDESHIAFVCFESLKALEYMHSSHRIHRDIKSDNVLLNLNGDIKLGNQLVFEI